MTENTQQASIGVLTIRAFARKHNVPEHFVRTLSKSGRLPGYYAGSRYYINDALAVEALNAMASEVTAR